MKSDDRGCRMIRNFRYLSVSDWTIRCRCGCVRLIRRSILICSVA